MGSMFDSLPLFTSCLLIKFNKTPSLSFSEGDLVIFTFNLEFICLNIFLCLLQLLLFK